MDKLLLKNYVAFALLLLVGWSAALASSHSGEQQSSFTEPGLRVAQGNPDTGESITLRAANRGSEWNFRLFGIAESGEWENSEEDSDKGREPSHTGPFRLAADSKFALNIQVALRERPRISTPAAGFVLPACRPHVRHQVFRI